MLCVCTHVSWRQGPWAAQWCTPSTPCLMLQTRARCHASIQEGKFHTLATSSPYLLRRQREHQKRVHEVHFALASTVFCRHCKQPDLCPRQGPLQMLWLDRSLIGVSVRPGGRWSLSQSHICDPPVCFAARQSATAGQLGSNCRGCATWILMPGSCVRGFFAWAAS